MKKGELLILIETIQTVETILIKMSLICLVFFSFSTLNAATYYVDGPTGNDGNVGSFANPWRTISKAARTNLIAGDIVYIRNSTGAWRYREQVTILNKAGTSANPITFQNYQNDIVIIDAQSFRDACIYFNNSTHIKIKGLECRNAVNKGIMIDFNSSLNIIESNKCYNDYVGILLESGNNNKIIGNECYNNTGGAGWSAGIQMNRLSDNNIILFNKVHHNGRFGIYIYRSTGNLIKGNYVYQNTGTYGGIRVFYDNTGGNCINKIINNVVFSNSVGIYYDDLYDGWGWNCTSWGNKICGNLIYNNTSYGIRMGVNNFAPAGCAGKMYLYYNTMYGNGNAGVYLHTRMYENCQIKNIITESNSIGINSVGPITIYNSCIADSYNVNVTLDSSCITSDPLFKDTANLNFHLKFNSPAMLISESDYVSAAVGCFSSICTNSNSYKALPDKHEIRFHIFEGDGGIPDGAKLEIKYKMDGGTSQFRFGTLSVLPTSQWGAGAESFTATGDNGNQKVDLVYTGNTTTEGKTEGIAISGITNTSIGGSYWVEITIRSNNDKFIKRIVSNDFFINYETVIKITKSISNIRLSENPVKAIPGSTIRYHIIYSNTGLTWSENTIIYDSLPSFCTYYTNGGGTATGWTAEWSTNASPNQSYNSTDYTNKMPMSKDLIKWIRWKKLKVNTDEDGLYLCYEIIIK